MWMGEREGEQVGLAGGEPLTPKSMPPTNDGHVKLKAVAPNRKGKNLKLTTLLHHTVISLPADPPHTLVPGVPSLVEGLPAACGLPGLPMPCMAMSVPMR